MGAEYSSPGGVIVHLTVGAGLIRDMARVAAQKGWGSGRGPELRDRGGSQGWQRSGTSKRMVTQEDGSGAASEAVGCHRGRGLLVGRGARAWPERWYGGVASMGMGRDLERGLGRDLEVRAGSLRSQWESSRWVSL